MSGPRLRQDGFTEYYLREREALREQGRDFAARHPKVAGRLRLEDDDNPDPHVERLRQSFAFLTARLQRKLDDEFPQVAEGLLSVLFPHLSRPIPSMAVVEVELDTQQGLPADGVAVPRGSLLHSRPVNGEPLQFRTGHDVRLWPFDVTDVRVDAPTPLEQERHPRARAALALTIEVDGEYPLGELSIEHLEITLKGEQARAFELYELLSTGVLEVGLAGDPEAPPVRMAPDVLQPGGFGRMEALLDVPRRSFAGYRLLQEYFACPQRFLFFHLGGLERTRGWNTHRFVVRFLLDRQPAGDEVPGTDDFGLRCIPIINLFSARADPIHTSGDRSSFPLVPDAHRRMDLEVAAVERVEGHSTRTGERFRYDPFYALRHGEEGLSAGFWHARRIPSLAPGDAGTEMELSLVQRDQREVRPEGQVLHVDLLCTNRDLPVQTRGWERLGAFRIDGVNGIRGVRCIRVPSPARRLEPGGEAYWRLISHLSLNQLSLVREGRDALRGILATYDFGGGETIREQIRGIESVESRPVMRWIRGEGGAGYCRGTETTIRLDRERFLGASPFLFAAVLERFLALYCSVHSFSELVLETVQDEGWKHRWKPRTGEKALL